MSSRFPADTPATKIAALANPATTPDEFFKAVHKAFPNALITVMNPEVTNKGYFAYYNVDLTTGKSPFADYSTGFDGIEAVEGKNFRLNQQALTRVENMLFNNDYKLLFWLRPVLHALLCRARISQGPTW